VGSQNEEHEFRVFMDKMPRKKFGSMNDEILVEDKENYIMQSFIIYTLRPIAWT
jgi:hypothetical protein